MLEYLIKRRTMLLRDQMVTASMGLANAAQAGLSLAQGLQKVGQETAMPLAAELNRIVRDHIKGGLPLLEAIVNVRQRLKVDAFSVFSLAIQSAMDRGGRINAALERISHSLQENQRLERKLLAETSAGRAAVLILALFPLVFLGILAVLSPDGVRLLFRTVWGQLALILAGALVFCGVRWAARILNIDM
ncbi:MAG: type II secretion system F family protein [Planctomycetota bacterium]|nr:type II secretion system F family protein [Planctomycetota bacterium]